MRLSDLRDKPIKTLDGETVGRVHEVHCEKGDVTALMCGAVSLIERLTAKKHGRRIPWDRVTRITADAVIIATESAKVSGSRTRRGTRRPSVTQSKR
jgi:sporulation protein YlmC with PRC-barrel domain